MTLRLDSAGTEVLLLQYHLTLAGFPAATTTTFDSATEEAVMAFQSARSLIVDGIVGPATGGALAQALRPKPPRAEMLVDAAKTLGVSVPTIQAVAEVESNGKGFLPSGRPTILFERHIFYGRLAAHGLNAELLATHLPWIVVKGSGGYVGGEMEHLRLLQAMTLHPAAAQESASWGAFQIMGYHWKKMGYASVDDFVARMHKGYAEHLDAFVRFISANAGLCSALLKKDWSEFARRYNGPGYAKNSYDLKLAEAYDRLVVDGADAQ